MKSNVVRKNAGFTLIELVAVLLILAIAASLALRDVSGRVEVRRSQMSRAMVSNLRSAVFCDGQRTPGACFVADFGRLPRGITNAMGSVTLGELWQCPVGADFRILQATSANGVLPQDVDLDIFVGVGWRGPYIAIPPDGRLLDPWGDELCSTSDVATDRLAIDHDGLIYGILARMNSGEPLESVSIAPPDTWNDTSLCVVVQAMSASGTVAPASSLGRVKVRLYEPDPVAFGSIKCISAETIGSSGDSVMIRLGGVIPGTRIVRVESDVAGKGLVHEVVVSPGENILRERFVVSSAIGGL